LIISDGNEETVVVIWRCRATVRAHGMLGFSSVWVSPWVSHLLPSPSHVRPTISLLVDFDFTNEWICCCSVINGSLEHIAAGLGFADDAILQGSQSVHCS